MPKLDPKTISIQAHERIAHARSAIAEVDYLCSGTLMKRMMKCGKATCACRTDSAARHGPYYEWGHMKDGKLVHRYVSAEQAEVLQRAIANYRNVQKLLHDWQTETERVLDAQYPGKR